MKPKTPLVLRPHVKRIMGWLFILAIASMPVTWFFFHVYLFLSALFFFILMALYQCFEVLVDDHHVKKNMAEFECTKSKLRKV